MPLSGLYNFVYIGLAGTLPGLIVTEEGMGSFEKIAIAVLVHHFIEGGLLVP